jgi:hypothetical protein
MLLLTNMITINRFASNNVERKSDPRRDLTIKARLKLAQACDRRGEKAKAAAIRSGIADQLMENLI